MLVVSYSVSRSSLIGVAIACSGNILISLALADPRTVQKLAHRRQSEELTSRSTSTSASGQSSPSRSPIDREGTSGSSSTKGDNDRHDLNSIGVPVLLIKPSTPRSSIDANGSDIGERVIPVHVESIDLSRSPSRGLDTVPEIPTPGSSQKQKRIKIPQGYNTSLNIRTLQSDSNGEHSRNDGQSQEQENGKQEVEEGAYLKSKLWWLGMCLIAVGEGGNFLSYGYAPASVVAPLGTVALIANCVFAPLILRETFHAKELIGMALAILGAVTVVWSSNASNPRLDPHGLVVAITQIPFIVYTSLNAFFAIILVLLSRSQKYGSKYIAIDVGVCALFGGYTVLSTKALSSLLSTIFLDAFKWWITWVLVGILIVTSILQVKYLNRALMRFQSKEVIPTQFVFFSLAGSAVLYQEFRDIAFSQIVNFAFGMATTFLGVHLLTSYSNPDGEEDENDNNDRPPPGPQRALSSASLNLLLPTSSRLSERTPLLIPINGSPETGTLQTTPPGVLNPGSGSLKGRLLKRTSTGDFAPTLGLSSQAGFLLMATTPPSSATGMLASRRERSASRGQIPHYTEEGRGTRDDRVRDNNLQRDGK